MAIYKQTVRSCAQEFDILSKIEKTAFLSGKITDFVNKGFIFIVKVGDKYFQYNMNTTEAFVEVKGKFRQAMKDFSRRSF